MGSAGQGHRHGVRKHLVEGIGGFLTGAALVLFVRGLARGRTSDKIKAGQSGPTIQATSGDPRQCAAKRRRAHCRSPLHKICGCR